MKKLFSKIKLGGLIKAAAKTLPVTSLIADVVDNFKASRDGKEKPHSDTAMYFQYCIYGGVFLLLIFKVVTVDDLIRILQEIKNLFYAASDAPVDAQ